MKREQFTIHSQTDAYSSSWTQREKLGLLCWSICWPVFCAWTPKPLNAWRMFWLRLFGAKLHGQPFVHQRARIQIPWNLTMHDRACLGDRANAYSLGPIELLARCTIAQEAYLCTGTHDFTQKHIPLMTAPILVAEDAFVGARAFVMPGIEIGAGAIVGSCSVVTKDVAAGTIVAGNPAVVIGATPVRR